MSNTKVAEFTPINELLDKLSEIIYKSQFPDDVAKFTVDLSIARTEKRLSSMGGGEGLFDYNTKFPTWHYLKVLTKGTGNWTIKIELKNKKTVDFTNDELNTGDEIALEFRDLFFTNTAQSVTNPVFWLEKRFF